MFHKIYHMYGDINNKEEANHALLLTRMWDHKDIKKVSKKTVNSHANHQNEFPFQGRMIVPPDLHQIQPRATKVWKCDEIGFDPNGKLCKFVCTIKYFQGEIMWKAQTGERAPFWCTLLVFNRDYGKWFIPPVVVHQEMSTPRISIKTTHWTGQSITHHLDTWIETGGLVPWSNYPTYTAPPLSTIR